MPYSIANIEAIWSIVLCYRKDLYTLVFIQQGIFRRLADQRNSNIEGFADKCGHHIFF